jgi:hypothetical protein
MDAVLRIIPFLIETFKVDKKKFTFYVAAAAAILKTAYDVLVAVGAAAQ